MPLAIVCLGIGLVAGCGSRKASIDRPVATPSFAVSRGKAPLGSPVEATYRFVVSPDLKLLDQDYRVLVHFLDSDDELMWTDDHDPPVPTSQWKPSQTIEYSRTMFIPVYPYIGKTSVQMGLYSRKERTRLPLAGEDMGQRAYRVGSMELLPQSENIFLIYKDGWHRTESAPDNAAIEWQWTKTEATINFRNPKRNALFYLEYEGRPDAFPEPQTATLSVRDQIVDTFKVNEKEPAIRKVSLSTEQLGSDDIVELKIQVDKTFKPSQVSGGNNLDQRELGLRVFHAFLEPH
ncbi:MAG: hypothetical protein HYX76_01495 [Acidobacteria bacterium]|nr:hypothetical protein [Acidobacteriota bacterium]